jgi:hypothetical protein
MALTEPVAATTTAVTPRPPAPSLQLTDRPGYPTPKTSEREPWTGSSTDDPPTCSCTTGHTDRLTRLAAAAREAAHVRSLTTRPDVVALRVDRIRAQVDALLWAGIGLGLLFTTVNVQAFAAAGAAAFTSGWWVAWLLDPMVSLVLLAVLRAEQVTARYQVELGGWPRCAKWCAFAATYLMNTWYSWGLDGGVPSVSGVVLHSVPPLLVLISAEAGPVLRERLTEAARRASTDHVRPLDTDRGAREDAISGDDHGHDRHPGPDAPLPTDRAVHDGSMNGVSQARADVREVAPRTGHAAGANRGGAVVRERAAREQLGTRSRSERPTRGETSSRRLFADYLSAARAALDDAAAQGQRPEPTPAWCRRTTGCSCGTSVKLAAALRADRQLPVVAADTLPMR